MNSTAFFSTTEPSTELSYSPSCQHSSFNLAVLLRILLDEVLHTRDIARSLVFNAAVALVHAFVFSRLDYCSSIFTGPPGASDGEAETGPLGCGATHWRVQEVCQHIPIYAGCITLASIPTAHLIQDCVCGKAVLVWLDALLSAWALLPSLFLCRQSYTAVLSTVI